MTAVNNIFRQIQTYQKSTLGYMYNLNCFIKSICNPRFKNFQDFEGNLGSTVTYQKPYRFLSTQGLVASFQPTVDRFGNLAVTQAENVAIGWTAQERIFNVDKDTEDFMKQYGMGAIATLSTRIEQDVAKQCASQVIYQSSASGITAGTYQTDSGPYRFYGNGVTAIDSFTKLADAIARTRAFGSVVTGTKVILPNSVVPSIVGSGLGQFAPKRNDEIAMSWEIGEFGTPPVQYYSSNLLPIHTAGNVGNATAPNNILTLISTNDPTGNNVTQLTLSGATASDDDAIFYSDMFQFNDGVSGLPNVRFTTFIGAAPTYRPFQDRIIAPAGANGSGNVTITLANPIVWAATPNKNVNVPLQAGMKITILPSHVAGAIVMGDAFFLAMPKLPDQFPFPTANEPDSETGVSLRLTNGSQFGQNFTGSVFDAVWGSTLDQDYSERLIFPLSQAA